VCGEWRARFGPRHMAAFERVAAALPAELGYEPCRTAAPARR